jgi:EAL domain-containing protein (putative c-di-GMP-specific phosphodiesterase class I)
MGLVAGQVLERSLRDLASWRAQNHQLSVAVNLSVSNLQDVELPQRVELLLGIHGIPAEALVLEITENILMADAERSGQVLDRLRAIGVLLSVDDYGTGYSSLAYLQALPVDELKLDRSFVTHMSSDPRAATIVVALPVPAPTSSTVSPPSRPASSTRSSTSCSGYAGRCR